MTRASLWIVYVIWGLMYLVQVQADTIPENAKAFLMEIRETLGNRWEILHNIQYHTVNTKLRIARLVEELEKSIEPEYETNQGILHNSKYNGSPLSNATSEQSPLDISPEDFTSNLGEIQSALNYNNTKWLAPSSQTHTEVADGADHHILQEKPLVLEESHTTTQNLPTEGMMGVVEALEALFSAQDRHVELSRSSLTTSNSAASPGSMKDVLTGLEALLYAQESRLTTTQRLSPTTVPPPRSMLGILADLESLFPTKENYTEPPISRLTTQDLPPTTVTLPRSMLGVLTGLESLLRAEESNVKPLKSHLTTQNFPSTVTTRPGSMVEILAALDALARLQDYDDDDFLASLTIPALHEPPEDIEEIITALEGLAWKHGFIMNTSVSDAPVEVTTEYLNILQIVKALEKLNKSLESTSNSTEKCEAPFVHLAYRMCILPETTLKLSWSAASDYCLRHGAVLAQDAVVIKTRRYLNDLYGETGTRERWPLWVGGKEIMKDHEKTWMWADSSLVPDFLWNKGHPRSYTRRQAPDGTCMFLDGYKNFYASSLPCHYRRRFVCQLPD